MVAASVQRPERPDAARRLFILAGLILFVAVLFAGAESALTPAMPAASLRHGYGPANFAAALATADQHVALGTERVARAPEQWAFQEYQAQALLARSRLTGSFADLARADAALARGLADAPPRAGPLLTAAVGAMAVHRLGPVPALLTTLSQAAVPAEPVEQAEALAIRGDLAFYRADYAGALAAYGRAARLANGPGVAVRLANWHQKQGNFDAALSQIASALALAKHPTRMFHANLLLQSGAIRLARGDWAGATMDFGAANRLFPGNWRAESMRAQMLAANGDTAAAVIAYQAILARPADEPPPEVMDALAALERARGDTAASRRWADRAGAVWAARLRLLPAAAIGHALDHELVFGTPARALALARQNVAARPYGDALVLLAQAQLQAGDPAAAVATLARVEASGWRSAPQYVVLANARALLGDGTGADAARAQALAINPRALDPAISLIWFGNH